jgi:hypothetical protein
LLLGMVSTHFANAHEPTAIELETLQSSSIVASEHARQFCNRLRHKPCPRFNIDGHF